MFFQNIFKLKKYLEHSSSFWVWLVIGIGQQVVGIEWGICMSRKSVCDEIKFLFKKEEMNKNAELNWRTVVSWIQKTICNLILNTCFNSARSPSKTFTDMRSGYFRFFKNTQILKQISMGCYVIFLCIFSYISLFVLMSFSLRLVIQNGHGVNKFPDIVQVAMETLAFLEFFLFVYFGFCKRRQVSANKTLRLCFTEGTQFKSI